MAITVHHWDCTEQQPNCTVQLKLHLKPESGQASTSLRMYVNILLEIVLADRAKANS